MWHELVSATPFLRYSGDRQSRGSPKRQQRHKQGHAKHMRTQRPQHNNGRHGAGCLSQLAADRNNPCTQFLPHNTKCALSSPEANCSKSDAIRCNLFRCMMRPYTTPICRHAQSGASGKRQQRMVVKSSQVSTPSRAHSAWRSRVWTIAVVHVLLAVRCLLSEAECRSARLESGKRGCINMLTAATKDSGQHDDTNTHSTSLRTASTQDRLPGRGAWGKARERPAPHSLYPSSAKTHIQCTKPTGGPTRCRNVVRCVGTQRCCL